jgi:hypothetical protein
MILASAKRYRKGTWNIPTSVAAMNAHDNAYFH